MEAVERYGAVRGGLMGLWRVLRCHPLARGGHDPVVKERGHENSAEPFDKLRRQAFESRRDDEVGHPRSLQLKRKLNRLSKRNQSVRKR